MSDNPSSSSENVSSATLRYVWQWCPLPDSEWVDFHHPVVDYGLAIACQPSSEPRRLVRRYSRGEVIEQMSVPCS